MKRSFRPGCCALAALAALVAGFAHAQPAKVRVEVLVAQVSTEGSSVDPRLQAMARDFKRNGLAFTTYKLVSTSSLELAQGASGSVKLPSGKAQLTMLGMERDGKLKLRVATPASTSDISMSRGGEAYIGAGSNGSSKLFLVVRR